MKCVKVEFLIAILQSKKQIVSYCTYNDFYSGSDQNTSLQLSASTWCCKTSVFNLQNKDRQKGKKIKYAKEANSDNTWEMGDCNIIIRVLLVLEITQSMIEDSCFSD